MSLPFYPGLIYDGPGIFFSVSGQEYEMTETNRAALEQAIKSGSDIAWTYSPSRARKYGVSSQADGGAAPSVVLRVLDTKAQLVPDISFTVQL